MNPIQLFDPASSTFTYILFDAATGEALIIDPVDNQLDRDLAVLRQHGLKLVWAVETHNHADHITSAGKLVEHTGAKTAAPAGCDIGPAATQLADRQTLAFGHEQILALHTPGHTAGSMSYYWEQAGAGATESGPARHVFTGDTLLIDGSGRTDFQSGDAAALYRSITGVLFTLPEDTVVWPAHDYRGRTHSTIGNEKVSNARIAGKSQAEFVDLMGALNLPPPARLAEAVAANRLSGATALASGGAGLQVRPADGYAGDVSPELALQWWRKGDAVLVDVRTDAEREWVGLVPGAVPLAWKQWPGMALNERFDDGLRAAVPQGKKLLLLCRSGVRSVAAAKHAASLGFDAYNILEGFEGDADENGQRGRRGGWRFRGLPWKQG
ncbi:MAG: MBL fold metallo-hydrolase [Comamonadaceae bacterium]|nr:MAG: MBL fold metallo-hydrolase [Comamonadaceae bacterium]